MNLNKWFSKRGFTFVIQRASLLLDRYGITPSKAMTRIEDSLMTLSSFGCSPTFFTPGIVVKRYPLFIRSLQEKGAEIGVHSYQHIDFSSLTLPQAHAQLSKAIETFHQNGIEVHGFRCPYLSCPEALLQTLPEGLFGYSSNRAIWLDSSSLDQNSGQTVIYNTLKKFYNPESFEDTVNMPWSNSSTIEIPVSVPDDLQLHDGLNLDGHGISQSWIEMLQQTHHRGELFNLIFHPELGSICKQSFEDLLGQAIKLKPAVWITGLHDICDWWSEKSTFGVKIDATPTGQRIEFKCSPRATILLRGLGLGLAQEAWDENYTWLKSQIFELAHDLRPFVGLASNVPKQVELFLQEQGYILDSSEKSIDCSIYIDDALLTSLPNRVQLINHIEASTEPLIRYGRWPNGAKSALSITGDLDALSLMDYASRLFVS
jgi:hypothetical protein